MMVRTRHKNGHLILLFADHFVLPEFPEMTKLNMYIILHVYNINNV